MQVRSNSSSGTSNRAKPSTVRGMIATLALGALIATGTQAAPITVNAIEDVVQPGFFTLNFGEAGGIASGNITSTDYGLEVDPVVGTARLVEYYQEVDSITLFGQFPTGDMIIEVVEGTSEGTYDPETRVFTTSEDYAVHFSGDLSAFGLESPVVLPSTSTGTLDLTTGRFSSHVDLNWNGVGQLNNPADPKNPIEFSYTCEINTNFTARAGQLIQLTLAPDVQALGLPLKQENSLVSLLDFATGRFNEGHWSAAVNNLTQFIADVDDASNIPVSAADELIEDTEAVIKLLRRPEKVTVK